ncbi:MAG: hypothetical protein IKO47_09075 [Ruminococcus sp.]|nr:hypothetical protein [Ruminococcus sp.]
MAEKLADKPAVTDAPPDMKSGNAFLYGVLGAFLGSLPGMTVWIILGKFGIRSMILGFFLAAGTVWGFGRMTRNRPLRRCWGILICTVIMTVSVYLTQRIIWTWSITESFSDTIAYLNEQVYAATQGNTNVTEESVRKSVAALNLKTFGFAEPSFGNCFTHFYDLIGFFGVKKDFFTSLVESYISAILGAASLMKNQVRSMVSSQLGSSKNKAKKT